MDVVILLVFISLGLVAASLFFFFHRLKEGDFDHADRLSLAPLDDEPAATDAASAADDDPQPEPAFRSSPNGGPHPSPPGELSR